MGVTFSFIFHEIDENRYFRYFFFCLKEFIFYIFKRYLHSHMHGWKIMKIIVLQSIIKFLSKVIGE